MAKAPHIAKKRRSTSTHQQQSNEKKREIKRILKKNTTEIEGNRKKSMCIKIIWKSKHEMRNVNLKQQNGKILSTQMK